MLSGIKMSVAETEAAITVLANSRPEGSISKVNLGSIPEAQNTIFVHLYHAYHNDLEGKHGIIKFGGDEGLMERLVSREEKKEDLIRLNEYYEAWIKKFSTNRHKDQILNLVVNEIKNDLDEIAREYKEGLIGKEEFEYNRKGTILRSKYLYIRITGIFEELDEKEVLVNFNGITIEITRWSMAHILNRHYAGAAKHYNSGKSFHQDPNLCFFEDPNEL